MIKAVIIDDLVLSHDIIKRTIEQKYNDKVKIVDSAYDVKSGVFIINKYKPDIVFLDVEMPDGTGFDLLKKLDNNNFKLIFITAHQEYAINAIKFSAIDYLLKPLDEDEICLAVEKVIDKIHIEEEQLKIKTFIENIENKKKKIIIKTADNTHALNIDDITYCESDNNYTYIHLVSGNKILASHTLKFYDNLLNNNNFVRVHKSFLINLLFVDKYEKRKNNFVILKNNITIPVSVRKKAELAKSLKNFFNN